MSLLPIIRRLLVSGEDQAEEAKRRLREQMLLGGVGPVPLGGNQVLTRNATTPYLSGDDTPLTRRTDQNGPIPVDPYARPDITPIIRQPTPLEPVPEMPAGLLTRPRSVNAPAYDPTQVLTRPGIPAENQGEPFGLSGDPFGSTRLRRTQPRDYIADDTQYLRDLEANPKEMGRKKAIALRVGLGLLGGGIPGAIHGAADEAITHRLGRSGQDQEIAKTQERLTREIGLQNTQVGVDYKNAQSDLIRRRPDIESAKTREQHRRTLASLYNRLPEFDPSDPDNADLVDAMSAAGLPVVTKSRANQLRFVQDARTGEWKVISGDRSTGEAIGRSVGTSEGASLSSVPTAQITRETQEENMTSRERIAGAGRASRESIAASNRQSRETIAEKRAYKSTRTPYTGRTMSAANLQRYARDKGLMPEQARAEVESQGIRVQ